MPFYNPNYAVATHTRVTAGTTSDLNVDVAQRPGWLLGLQAFSFSSAAAAHLYLYDTTSAITTTMAAIWQAVIPYNIFVEGTTRGAVGAGVISNDMGLSFNNGLRYAISSGSQSSIMSTAPSLTVKINLTYQTSSCL